RERPVYREASSLSAELTAAYEDRAATVAIAGCYGPKADIAGLFDHLVGSGEHRRWNCEAKRLGGLEIDYQLVLGRRLHRKIGWLLTPEDAIDIASRGPELATKISPGGAQAGRGRAEASL